MSVLTNNAGLDRATHLRNDLQAVSDLLHAPDSRVLRVHQGRFAWDTDTRDSLAESETFFLGLDPQGTAYFARNLRLAEGSENYSLREIEWPDLERAIATHAVALVNWHESHPRCPRCGSATKSILAGAARRCVVDGSEHHPRSDPAVIVLVRDQEDRVLLGRQSTWPQRRFSAFAGFVEPGETLEACVHRELHEECGIEVDTLVYLGSQPWPFPASLMVAFTATAIDPLVARPDGDEITEIAWFTRDQLQEAFLREEVLLPPTFSIARRMIENWYGAELHR